MLIHRASKRVGIEEPDCFDRLEVFQMGGVLWAIIVVLFVLWLLGWLAFHIGGGLIHILIVIALILLIVNLVSGRGARV
jgi:hypothetical protein